MGLARNSDSLVTNNLLLIASLLALALALAHLPYHNHSFQTSLPQPFVLTLLENSNFTQIQDNITPGP